MSGVWQRLSRVSGDTDHGSGEKEGFGAIIDGQISMKTNYATNRLGANVDIPVSNQKIFKFYDHGSDDISNVDILKITKIN